MGTTHLAAMEKRLHQQLETLQRETTAVTSRLRQEKMRFSDAKRRLTRESTKERGERRRRREECRRKTLTKRKINLGNCQRQDESFAQEGGSSYGTLLGIFGDGKKREKTIGGGGEEVI